MAASVTCVIQITERKFIQIDIRDTDSYSYSLFQVIALSNLLFINDSYKKSRYALEDLSYGLKIKFISDVTIPWWPTKSVKPNFWQYPSDRNNNKFNCYFLEIQLKIVTRISVTTLNPFKLSSNQIDTSCQFPVVTR